MIQQAPHDFLLHARLNADDGEGMPKGMQGAGNAQVIAEDYFAIHAADGKT